MCIVIKPLLRVVITVVLNFNSSATIHAEAPDFVEMSTDQEILVTGIKVVDLLAPYVKGGKIGEKCIMNIVT